MARSQINEVVALSNTGVAVNGARVTITRDDSSPVTVWDSQTGGNPLPQPLVTVNGQISGWLDDGSYRLQIDPPVTGPVFSSQTAFIEVVNGDGHIAALANKQDASAKGQPNGYAPLGSDSKVPSANLPSETDPVASAALAIHIAGLDPHGQYQLRSEEGVANGYAGLDSSGHVPGGQLVGVPIFIQASQPASPPAPSIWIPLDTNGSPLPPNQWQVFV